MSWLKRAKIQALLELDENLGEAAFEQCLYFVQGQYGNIHLAYVCMWLRGRPLGEPFVRSTYPAVWVEQYRKERYERIDPIIRVARRSGVPVEWASLPRGERRVERMFAEAADAGVGREGLIIPVRGPVNGIHGFLSIASSETGSAWESWRDELFGEFILIASHLHQRVCDRYGPGECVDLYAISRREREAVAWMADGRPVEEIGVLMGCSAHTVKHYLDSVRLKLGASNRVHMVAKAIRAGLIS